ncbi:Voltage-dependent T-type calcium channel subunit alpha-1G Cav3.1c [Scomber scombrus]|uniref:Voltage-dependent T-type calcium channel subunit alpha-1G Cav3.1c n=1 Tax=Scomber scombrus TaxID=13677 RepID=A0AAV1PT00_SCOSC
MAEDGRNLSGVPDARGSEGRSSLPRTFIRLNDLSGVGTGGGERGEVVVEPASPAPDGISTAGEEASASGDENLPYPTLAPVVFFYLKQTTRPRSWCLKMSMLTSSSAPMSCSDSSELVFACFAPIIHNDRDSRINPASGLSYSCYKYTSTSEHTMSGSQLCLGSDAQRPLPLSDTACRPTTQENPTDLRARIYSKQAYPR